jgi:hypothetical protein
MAMSLVAQPPGELVEIDDRYPDELTERRALLATSHAAVFAAVPGSEPARAEVLELLAPLLTRRYPEWFVQGGDTLHNRLTGESWNVAKPTHDPLEVAGRLVQEDLCVIDTSGPSPILAAAVLCAPSRWLLAEKIGRPLAEVHGPVPLYAERLSAAVDRFMANLRPGKLVERQNWSILDGGALFQPSGHGVTAHDARVTARNATETLFLRVERQTLARLPRAGAVLFAIRVHSYRLDRVLSHAGVAATLAAAIRAVPENVAAYKSLYPFRAALLACLDSRAAVDRERQQ